MATIDIGKLTFTHKGDYAGGTAYVANDVVYYNGSAYVAKTSTTGNLPTSTAHWNTFAAGSGGIWNSGLSLGSAGQVVKVNSGASALEFGTISSDFVRLGQVNQTSMVSSISVDFFTTDYDIFKVFVTGLNISSAGAGTALRFNSSAGTAVSGSNYRFIFSGGMRNNSGSSSADQKTHGWDADMMNLSNGSPNNYEQGNHEITVFRPMNASEQTKCIATGGGYENNHIYSRQGQGVYNNTEAHTGITFLATTGNISIEHIEVYGIK